ncbi:Protein of unknown function (DUF3152) [Micromonospora auratinigra]|uniref:DUF3152 domain-containing protein n=2 Tax=Micromonospora auratinigra TaxID=261654 RepID=A0A1A8Z484_9ACTN|nr:DUF3152 domain-containing protein [Micromonospora auratinigra]SBT38671.1 Protein of unknown function (DUF3152) [Micromonospora auratinigra]
MLLSGCAAPASGGSSVPAAPTGRAEAPARVTSPPGASRTAAPVTYPADGGNRWRGAAAEVTAPHGTGRLLRYRVGMERDIQGLPVTQFAAEVSRTLNHPQGWTADGRLRLRRVGWDQPSDFTIYLATPGTRDVLCQDTPDGYTSCRTGDRVVLNVARWVNGVPGYGASLATYHAYMVNHEVGHRLGHGHELCPGRGQPAPVMQQQTLGLHGCTANAAPYLDGERYTGPSGAYDDPVPPRDHSRMG